MMCERMVACPMCEAPCGPEHETSCSKSSFGAVVKWRCPVCQATVSLAAVSKAASTTNA